jgi:hypothetical protein
MALYFLGLALLAAGFSLVLSLPAYFSVKATYAALPVAGFLIASGWFLARVGYRTREEHHDP